MKVLTLLFLAGVTSGSPGNNRIYAIDQAEDYFKEFIKTYDKRYADEAEKQKRFEIFKQNLRTINEKNLKSESAVFGITMFSDLTNKEFIERHTGYTGNMLRDGSECDSGSADPTKAPDSFDWRDKGVVSKAKNQLICGSCWAFSAIGNVEAQYAIKHKELLDLSEQQLVDCDTRSSGCHGTSDLGYPFLYLIENSGSIEEQDYPYKSAQGGCKFDASKVKVNVTGCVNFQPNSEEELKNILHSVGPLTIGVDASDFQGYTGNVLAECNFIKLNHAVLLVGYGTENGVAHWVIKNSWGENFGEEGFIKVKRGVNACGLMTSAVVQGVVA